MTPEPRRHVHYSKVEEGGDSYILELRHLLPGFTTPGGGWPSPNFGQSSSPTTLKLYHGGGFLLQIASHRTQGNQCLIKTMQEAI